jgi:hypothetical protein
VRKDKFIYEMVSEREGVGERGKKYTAHRIRVIVCTRYYRGRDVREKEHWQNGKRSMAPAVIGRSGNADRGVASNSAGAGSRVVMRGSVIQQAGSKGHTTDPTPGRKERKARKA